MSTVICEETGAELEFCPSHEPGKFPRINVDGRGAVFFKDHEAKNRWMQKHIRRMNGNFVSNREGAYVPK